MNKILNPNLLGAVIPIRFNLFTIMRVFLLLIVMGLSSVYANSTYAQTKINIDVNNVNLEDLFKEIQGKSEFIFFYKDDVLNKDKRITLHLKRTTLAKILKRAFAGTDLDYTIDDRQVVIKKRPEKTIQGSTNENLEPLLQSTVTGTVTDADGSPLPGANILVKGTTNGTQTDFDGNYTIEAESNATLVFSYLGFATQEVTVGGQTTINVSMAEDAGQLQEVVVLGYVTQTRGDLTGSVASVDMDEALKAPITNAAEALQGRVSGISVVNSAAPGAAPKINIRGFGTSNNTDPLYIIDGVQTDDSELLNSINPSDIEQMNVLKDGSAAIYGARAANGVVIITTKGGGYNMDKAKVSVDMYTGIAKAANLPDLLNAQQHGDMVWESLNNTGATLSHPQYGTGSSPTVPSQLQGPSVVANVKPGGTDWLDEVFQSATTQNISLSLQNGSESGKYYMSASYLNREGIQINTGYKRGSTRLNSEFKVSDKVRIGEHLNVSFSRANTSNEINLTLRSNPLIPVRDEDGNFAGTYNNSFGLSNGDNPVASLTRTKDDYEKSLRTFGDIYLTADLIDGLTFKTTISGNMQAYNDRLFTAKNPENAEAITSNTLKEIDFNKYSWTWSNTLNYSKTFGEHSLNALVGIEAVSESIKGKEISRTDYFFETPDFYLLNNGTGTPSVEDAYDETTSLYSIFGTANYSYQGKYLATATVRRDKSSRFEGDNRVGVFPSFSVGWVMDKEDWYPQDAMVNRLKLKASWGKIGNQSIPVPHPTRNISILSEEYSNYSLSGNNGDISFGAILNQIGNPDLKWETSISKNIGVDLGLLNNALSVSFEYFNITTEDLITQDFSLISTTAIDATAPYVNFGDVKNVGFDLAVGYNNETSSGFSYGINANISHYKNEVTSSISDFTLGFSRFRGGAITRTEVGQPISSFYGRVVTGLDNTGRFTYKEIDGEAGITDGDREYIGSPHPDFTYGLNLTAAYKGFDASLFLNGSQGNDIYNYEKIFTDFPTFFDSNRSTRILDAWTPSNTGASLPALGTGITNNETSPNSFFVEDGSYLRLQNLQIGYTFADSISDKIGMSSFRLYVQGSNLFTITGYDGINPEITYINPDTLETDNLTLGVDSQVYPSSTILTLGVNLKF